MSRPAGNSPSDYGFEAPGVGTPLAKPDRAAPPRKLAVGDPGFNRIGPMLRILLDHEEVLRCVAYDVNKGTITRHRLDDAGRIFVDPETQKVATETLRGSVEVRWR